MLCPSASLNMRNTTFMATFPVKKQTELATRTTEATARSYKPVKPLDTTRNEFVGPGLRGFTIVTTHMLVLSLLLASLECGIALIARR